MEKEKETEIGDILEDKKSINSRKFGFSSKKQEKNIKVKWGDPLNPYMTNWPSSFLKIGYNVGFHCYEYQKGVPLLRIQKLKKNVVFPPLYTIQYNKYTEKNSCINNETEKLACNSVVKKICNPMKTQYSSQDFQRNLSKKSYKTYYNKNFFSKDNKDLEINVKFKNKLKSKKNFSQLDVDKNINIDSQKEILIINNETPVKKDL